MRRAACAWQPPSGCTPGRAVTGPAWPPGLLPVPRAWPAHLQGPPRQQPRCLEVPRRPPALLGSPLNGVRRRSHRRASAGSPAPRRFCGRVCDVLLMSDQGSTSRTSRHHQSSHACSAPCLRQLGGVWSRSTLARPEARQPQPRRPWAHRRSAPSGAPLAATPAQPGPRARREPRGGPRASEAPHAPFPQRLLRRPLPRPASRAVLGLGQAPARRWDGR